MVNSLAEDYFFYSNDLRGAKKQFWPLIAGITHPSADYYCQISRKNRIAPYTVVLEYVMSGKGYIETEGKRYEVYAGDTYIINRAIPAKWYSDKNDPYEKKWFNFTGRFADALMYTYNLNEPVYVVRMDSEDKLDEIHRILMEFDFQNPRQDNFRLMKLVLEKRIAHGGHPVLRWMMDNIYIRTDPAGNIKADKEKSTEKIDGAIAAIMGLDRAIRCGNVSTASVYDDRGILFI